MGEAASIACDGASVHAGHLDGKNGSRRGDCGSSIAGTAVLLASEAVSAFPPSRHLDRRHEPTEMTAGCVFRAWVLSGAGEGAERMGARSRPLTKGGAR